MSLKYKCLVLDHDDTVVNSTATIHYPSFMEYCHKRFPNINITLEEYIKYNFDPGVVPFFKNICGMSDEDMKDEQDFWIEYVKNHVPKAYPGIKEIIEEYKKRGGIVAVVSHSYSENILRDYKENGLPMPDITFGWEIPRELRKPSPWALEQIMKKYNLSNSDLVVIDDLKPGYDMAKSVSVPFIAAGWSNDIEEIETFMRNHCDKYCKSVSELYSYLFD